MPWPSDMLEEAAALVAACADRGLVVTTAESCTGGLVAACLTEIAGSSAVVDHGFITYSNAAKTSLLGVTSATLERFGAVSRETAIEMARGALASGAADVAVAVTGIAGPGGGTATKPVGLVHLATAGADGRLAHDRQVFAGSRSEIRMAAVRHALSMLRAASACSAGRPKR